MDIEFLVQYLVLQHSHQYPDLYAFTDNIRILNAVETHKLLSQQQAEQLREAYKVFRAAGHRQTLQDRSSTLSDNALKEYRDSVADIWQTTMQG